MTAGLRFWSGAATAIARHPCLWPTAITQAGRLARPRWWLHPPFLPVPHREYLRLRFETQYGHDRDAEPDDVITYLEWCRQMTRLRRGTPR